MSKRDKGFQIILVMLGFILGILGAYSSKIIENKLDEQSIIKLVKVGVSREVFRSKNVKKDLKIRKNVGTIIPESFNTLHDFNFYFSIQERFCLLENEVVVELDSFYHTLITCKNHRNVFQKGLEYCQKNKLKELPSGYLELYLTSLDRIIYRGEKLLKKINEFYPELEGFDPSVYFDPYSKAIEIPGYIQKD